MGTTSDQYSNLLAALTQARSTILSPPWQAELDEQSADVRIAAGKAGMDLEGAILTLSNSSLSDIADEMQKNEADITSATSGLCQALKDITKVQTVLSSIQQAVSVIGKVVKLL